MREQASYKQDYKNFRAHKTVLKKASSYWLLIIYAPRRSKKEI